MRKNLLKDEKRQERDYEQIKEALENKKSVICEKPMVIVIITE